MTTDDGCKSAAEIEATCQDRSTSVPRRNLPWGIRFHFQSAGVEAPSLAVVRAAVARKLPGWEIRPAVLGGGWFEAAPPPLPDYIEDSTLKGRFVCRLEERLACIERGVYGIQTAYAVTGLPDELASAFLSLDDEGAPATPDVAAELISRVAADLSLQKWLLRWRPGSARLPLLLRLRKQAKCGEKAPRRGQTRALCERLTALQQRELDRLAVDRWGEANDPARLDPAQAITLADPPSRLLRAYSFDPSLATTLDTAPIHQVTIPTRWEPLAPGPVGDYLEVVDIDYASDSAYLPVDLEQPAIIAQDGLPPSEGNPQFHQQMVYAVAMNTIQRFERALGRPIFWSPLRPWLDADERGFFPPPAESSAGQHGKTGGRTGRRGSLDAEWTSRYVQRLRIYPHALREANAYYSPTKRALLFGYFPHEGENSGMVFTCLSHDIIVHETTHAIVDGMHSYFREESNEDVLAFHEAFADIMALFQHFTYPEVLRHQIAATRGDLEIDNLLGQMAQQFGKATGRDHGLRNYLGDLNDEGKWERKIPDPRLLKSTREPHERGSILVSAVFDAFLALYDARVRDLYRIATGGSGVLPAGQIHPDLANRLAEEAAQTAEVVLAICIRAMDYLPPVDITFGEFLRALITADFERFSTAGHTNRIAFIEAFRSWGIYPRDVTTLSEESLRWRHPGPESPLQRWLDMVRRERNGFMDHLQETLEAWRPGGNRRESVFAQVMEAQAGLYRRLEEYTKLDPDKRLETAADKDFIPGIDLSGATRFSVDNMRPTRSIGPDGEFRTAMIVEIVQRWDPEEKDRAIEPPIRGGATLVIDLQTWKVNYIIYKSLFDYPASKGDLTLRGRQRAQLAMQLSVRAESTANLSLRLATAYASSDEQTRSDRKEPFALLHRSI